ncbi:hypothetical protein BGE01nite_42740 [Brevifollis gellanilyticus]|uniref:Uncharacterized protein n=1 Tax=Brevifollis gellanilyticus TaxID=748831 RepID=A0A512ME19_9BACT|nr:hypothetical protein BGE01nite_42740 [Brevifollis gellanilyticus]
MALPRLKDKISNQASEFYGSKFNHIHDVLDGLGRSLEAVEDPRKIAISPAMKGAQADPLDTVAFRRRQYG